VALLRGNSYHFLHPAPLEQQLDSPTEEQLNADWLSQLGVGRIFWPNSSCRAIREEICVNRKHLQKILNALHVNAAEHFLSHGSLQFYPLFVNYKCSLYCKMSSYIYIYIYIYTYSCTHIHTCIKIHIHSPPKKERHKEKHPQHPLIIFYLYTCIFVYF